MIFLYRNYFQLFHMFEHFNPGCKHYFGLELN